MTKTTSTLLPKLFACLLLCVLPEGKAKAQVINIEVSPYLGEIINAHVPASIGLDVEQAFKTVNSVALSYALYLRSSSYAGDGSYSGSRINLAYKRYLGSKTIYHGFYISPHFSYLSTSAPEPDEPEVPMLKGSSKGLGAGLNLGYQWLLRDRFTLGLEAGTTFYRSEIEKRYQDGHQTSYFQNHWDVNFSFSVGVLIFDFQKDRTED